MQLQVTVTVWDSGGIHVLAQRQMTVSADADTLQYGDFGQPCQTMISWATTEADLNLAADREAERNLAAKARPQE